MHRTIAVAAVLAALPCAVGRSDDNAADNPRVTRTAFDKIKWLMPSKEIETILGKGELVEDSAVLHAMGSRPGATGEPYEWVELGLWMKWKGTDSAIYVQFGGPKVVHNPDGTYSVGPNTEGCMVLFITEKPAKTMRIGQRDVVIRDIQIAYKYGSARGEIRHRSESRMGP